MAACQLSPEEIVFSSSNSHSHTPIHPPRPFRTKKQLFRFTARNLSKPSKSTIVSDKAKQTHKNNDNVLSTRFPTALFQGAYKHPHLPISFLPDLNLSILRIPQLPTLIRTPPTHYQTPHYQTPHYQTPHYQTPHYQTPQSQTKSKKKN